MSHALANPAHQPRQMDQVRVLTMSFPLQNALVAVNQQRRYRMPGAQRKDFATMTSSAAAKGKWAARKGFAKLYNLITYTFNQRILGDFL